MKSRAPEQRVLAPAADRTALTFLLALAAAVLVLHVLGAGAQRGTLWGADAYGFLPTWLLPAAAVALGAAIARAWRVRGGGESALPAWLPYATALAAFALFWFAREGHTFLGDGSPLSQNLPKGERFHPHEPLTAVIQHHVYTFAHRFFEREGRAPEEVARDAVALGSAIAGALFTLVAFPLGEALAALSAPGRPRAPRLAAGLATAVLLAQGYAQLFFGYVENYTWVTLAIGLYVLALLRAHARKGSLAPAGVLLVLCVALHLSAVTLAPAWLVLAGIAWRDRARRGALLRDAFALLATALAARALLAWLGSGYDAGAALWDMVTRATHGHGEGGRVGYLVSWQHALDLLNEHTLIGPAATALALFGAVRVAMVPRARTAEAALLLALALPPLAAAFVTGDLNLGYPRDWDLFAPYAVAYAAAGLGLLAQAAPGPHALARPLALALALSVFHTAPWVAVNASFERSFARFKTLPLGAGRTESVVGQWYFDHGDSAQAREWLTRATQVNPNNTAAQWLLGLMALDAGREDEAVVRFDTAVRVRPDKVNYRLSLVDALAWSGHPAEALPHVRVLLERDPARTGLWGCAAILFAGAGENAQAVRAAESAVAAAPGDTLRTSLLEAVRGGEPYVQLMKRWWDPLFFGPAPAGAPQPAETR